MRRVFLGCFRPRRMDPGALIVILGMRTDVAMKSWLALLLVSLALSLGTAVVAFRRRKQTAAALSFAAIPLCHVLWTALEIVGSQVHSVDGKLFISGVEWMTGLGMVAASL